VDRIKPYSCAAYLQAALPAKGVRPIKLASEMSVGLMAST
jgi:hypothetical protein